MKAITARSHDLVIGLAEKMSDRLSKNCNETGEKSWNKKIGPFLSKASQTIWLLFSVELNQRIDVLDKVARFFLEQCNKTRKIYQMTTKYTKCP
jgi:hypothetical protein